VVKRIRRALGRVLGNRRLLACLGLFLVLGLMDACWLERRVFLLRDDVHLEIPGAPPIRFVQLSDLHIDSDHPLLHKLLDQVREAKPDVILISGDFIQDLPDRKETAHHTAVAVAFIAGLRRVAPVVGVQGHSEYDGEVITALDHAGVAFLSNEGRRIGKDGSLLLLGVNVQVGDDAYTHRWKSPFRMLRWRGTTLYGARRDEPFRNFYSHWDPQPAGFADESGPLAWSGYDTVCDTWIDNSDVGSGIAVHSRFVLGEDRMYRLRRARAENGQPGSFFLVAHGTTLTGKLDTGVDPKPGRWYRLRVHTEVVPGAVRLAAKVWPADAPEPRDWQAVAEDRGAHRVESGTVGLWGWGGGTVLYRNLKVTDAQGEVLLDAPLAGPAEPPGFRKGPRGTRLSMALARSPYVPKGTPRIVLSHTPDIVMEASTLGIEAVIAGHTHGGQVRLPFVGALVTRNSLGPYYSLGRYEFAAPNRRGLTTLFINGGIGTSVLPIRFWCPPRWAVIEVGGE
jgi:predicted MPP superfamily phosphohydrolase